jgi:hypothetical protein
MPKQTFQHFQSAGIKVETQQLLVVPIDHDESIPLTTDDAVRLRDMPSWDVDEIMEALNEVDKQNFWLLLMKAVRTHMC